MSTTQLLSVKTKTASPYMGSLRLAGTADSDDEFGGSCIGSSSRKSSPASPYTVPPRGALVFQQHVHRYPKPIEPSQKLRIWYRGVFWETLEPWENILVRTLTDFQSLTRVTRRLSADKASTLPLLLERLDLFPGLLFLLASPTSVRISHGQCALASLRKRETDALLIALVSILYFAITRIFAPARLVRLTGRAQWYLTGVGGSVASSYRAAHNCSSTTMNCL
ncbi:hypothetical protein JCM10908_003519 [Rhodotorula pacifica]|uniref:uncharacterized protein n=1 Tax=Rhodotorula pacifica TaxID=1495444 RepID=UPI00318224C0